MVPKRESERMNTCIKSLTTEWETNERATKTTRMQSKTDPVFENVRRQRGSRTNHAPLNPRNLFKIMQVFSNYISAWKWGFWGSCKQGSSVPSTTHTPAAFGTFVSGCRGLVVSMTTMMVINNDKNDDGWVTQVGRLRLLSSRCGLKSGIWEQIAIFYLNPSPFRLSPKIPILNPRLLCVKLQKLRCSAPVQMRKAAQALVVDIRPDVESHELFTLPRHRKSVSSDGNSQGSIVEQHHAIAAVIKCAQRSALENDRRTRTPDAQCCLLPFFRKKSWPAQKMEWKSWTYPGCIGLFQEDSASFLFILFVLICRF